MTLIITALNRRHTVVVSDRRLTYDGKLIEDESNKAATLICRDARLAVAFTGLGKLGAFLTRRWILEALSKAVGPDHCVEPLLAQFAQLATSKFGTFVTARPEDKRLSVLCAGYVHEESGPRGIAALISNFDGWNSEPSVVPRSQFDVTWMREKRPAESVAAIVATAGMTAAFREEDGVSLRDLLLEDKPSGAIVGKAVEALRNAADSPKARNAIGKQCTSIVLPSDPSEPIESRYHSFVRSKTLHGVSHVEARGGPHGVYMIDSPILEVHTNKGAAVVAGPKLGRNQSCWCGSGKKFKKCHGKGN